MNAANKVTRAMRVMGLMSGTSADGIDAALVRVSGGGAGSGGGVRAKFEKHHHVAFPRRVREAILRLANGAATTTGEISQLNFLIGEEFARAAQETCRAWRVPMRSVGLIGSHGQTIYHQGRAGAFLGVQIASTLQIGEASVIAARTGVPVVADFRPADMAAGGHGAPLVPFVDYLLYRHERRGRVALNIGGVANLSLIPPSATPSNVLAFDTGPGNMIVDALMEHYTRGRAAFDRDAKFAMRGHVIEALLKKLSGHPFLREAPPKTAGREQFGSAYAAEIVAWAAKRRSRPEDVVRTATVFTALSIADAFRKFVFPRSHVSELIVAGGGAQNPLLMAQLAAMLPGITILDSTLFGVPSAAKEAFAFAVLAYESFHGRANNLPSATGARHFAVMGKISHPPLHTASKRGSPRGTR
jgi:anhydro-N-acetylmuramic acid kinase